MNIFYIHEDPRDAARDLCDKHMKMLLESAQMLSTAVRILLPKENHERIYRATHVNHPSNIWVRESRQNLTWTLRHADEISKEYTKRYGKTHKSMSVVKNCFDLLKSNVDKLTIPVYGTAPALAMPEIYKNPGEKEREILLAENMPIEVVCYRYFYCVDKRSFTEWHGNVPKWYKNGVKYIDDRGRLRNL
jgi:hypothetical protein